MIILMMISSAHKHTEARHGPCLVYMPWSAVAPCRIKPLEVLTAECITASEPQIKPTGACAVHTPPFKVRSGSGL